MILPESGRGTAGEAGGGGGAPRTLRPEVALARRLRRQMSLPEILLWQRLRGGNAGVKVRRQHPIGDYVADFFCRDASLVIEIDGEAHGRGGWPERDAARDRFMKDNGLDVLRIRASDVLRDVEAVTSMIVARAARPLHHSPAASGPPPRIGEDYQ